LVELDVSHFELLVSSNFLEKYGTLIKDIAAAAASTGLERIELIMLENNDLSDGSRLSSIGRFFTCLCPLLALMTWEENSRKFVGGLKDTLALSL
jgi:hypothetical protein